jgi:hypothetical protein
MYRFSPPLFSLFFLFIFFLYSLHDAAGATALHICLAEQQEHAWFLAPPLVAAGADLNAPWHRPLPNWAEVINWKDSCLRA